MFSTEEITIRKFKKLRMKNPRAVFPNSHKREIWICDCGREKIAQISYVVSGQTTSCGRCNEISEEEMASRKFGKLRMKFPKSILPGSKKKEMFVCDCGRETEIELRSVISENTSSCGRCNEISEEEMKTRKFGKLQMKFPKDTLPGSGKKEIWICDCGKEKLIQICYVVSGHTISCGRCSDSVYDWYINNIEKIKSLKCPIKPEDFPSGGPIPLEVIKRVDRPFKCQCVLCGRTHNPRLSDIKGGNGGLTCGCSTYRVSSGQRSISLFIESLGFKTELEHEVNKLLYDIFTPFFNLLIEYDGIHWHSLPGVKERDQRKEQNALSFGYGFLRITENEWIKNRDVVENQLRNMLANSNSFSRVLRAGSSVTSSSK